MIHKLDIKDPTQTPIPWLAKIDAFKKPRSFEFTPGLNILWGANGAGKTSLTKLLARLFHCEQGGHPVVTLDSLAELVGDRFKPAKLDEGIAIEHDGQGVRHFDSGHTVGVVGGGAGFDWDFGMEGIQNTMFKGSAGQTTMFRSDRLLNEIIAGEVPEVQWKVNQGERLDLAKRILKKNGKKGPPTVLLDEPERSYDLNAQVGIWRLLRAYSAEVQFIVASHSLFALKIPEANYIELTPGYLAKSIAAVELLRAWPAEKPAKVPDKVAQKARDGIEKAKKQR